MEKKPMKTRFLDQTNAVKQTNKKTNTKKQKTILTTKNRSYKNIQGISIYNSSLSSYSGCS